MAAETAVYTVSTTTSVTATGTIPSGSIATYSQTYGTVSQITSNNSATLTISGYAGKKITSIVLSMKSNASKGKGTLEIKAGKTVISSISSTAGFNTANWYGAWSTSYVNVTKTPTSYDIQTGEDVVVKIAATENSLFIEKYSITYETVGGQDCTTPEFLFIEDTVEKLVTDAPFTNNFISDNESDMVWTSSNTAVATVDEDTGEVTIVGAGSTTISVTQEADGTYCAVDASYTLNVNNLPFTVSFDAGTGTYAGGSLTETSGGAGVTLPAATGCGEWTFAGWATTAVSETTTAPTLLLAGSKYYPTTNITLHAVYSVAGSTEMIDVTASYGFEASDTGWTVTVATQSTGDKHSGTYSGEIKANGATVQYGTKIAVPKSFTFWFKKATTNNNHEAYIEVSSDGSSWTKVGTYAMSEFSNSEWRSKTADLSSYSDIFVRFSYYGTTAVRYIDDLSVVHTTTMITNTYNSSPNCSSASISVSEATVSITAEAYESDEDMIEVTASNLTEKINVALSGTDAAMFSFELDENFEDLEGGYVCIYYNPTAVGNHSATLTISSGDISKQVALSGTATVPTVPAPIALRVDGNLFKKVTAVWGEVAGAHKYELNVYQKVDGGIVTETESFDNVTPNGDKIGTPTSYLPGWSVLSQGTRQIYTSTDNYGVASPSFALTTTGDYIQTAVYPSYIQAISFWAKQQSGATSSTLIEGKNSSNQWVTIATLSNADVSTQNVGSAKSYDLEALNLIDIKQIRLVYTKALGNLAIDDITVTTTGVVNNHVAGSPFTVTETEEDPATPGVIQYTADGLERTTEYWFSVVAFKGEYASLPSEEINFTTGPLTDVEQTLSSKAIYAHNEQVFVHTTAGTSIEIFNVAGQKVSTTIAHDGLNIIPVTQKGVLVVKVGGMDVVKVVN